MEQPQAQTRTARRSAAARQAAANFLGIYVSPDDAKRFDEHKGLEFQVNYEAKAAGKEKLDGKLKFAICIETSCSPVTETFSIAIDVK